MKPGIALAVVFCLTFGIGLLLAAPSHADAAAAATSGKEIFTAQKCNTCHSISSQGIEAKTQSEKMKGPDLSDVGSKHDAAWISGWLQHKEKKDGKTHKGQFKGTDEEMKTLIDWLLTLKKG